MKKLFTFFALSALVLGMASCGDGNDPQNDQFDIQFSDVTSITATITVTPNDPNAWYFCYLFGPYDFEKEGGAKYTVQELLDKNLQEIKNKKFDEIKSFLFQKQQSAVQYHLIPETEYLAVVVQIDENCQVVCTECKSITTGPAYVDLGLSVLWSANEYDGYYTVYSFQDAKENFGNSVPTDEQWLELRDNCTWEWRTENDAFGVDKHWIVRSKLNNNLIVLQPYGYYDNSWLDADYGFFWSRSGEDSEHNTAHYFNLPPECPDCMSIDTKSQALEMTIRTVKEK